MLVKLFLSFPFILLSLNLFANDEIPKDCKEDLPIIEKSFYGNWTEIRKGLVSYITYNSDNTFTGRVERKGKVAIFDGTWFLDGKIKHLNYTRYKDGKIKKGTSIDEILQVTCNEYKFKYIKSGRIGSLKRIKHITNR